MLCQFERLVYPRDVRNVDASSYMVAVYSPCEKILDAAGKLISKIKAVGYCLPVSDGLRYDMRGHWSKSAKHGVQFEVENFDEVIIPNRENIIAYLSSGQIKGIGPKIAERIYDTFGDAALDILDKEPDKLLSVSGISSNKLKKICDSYIANRGARDVVAFLSPHGITANRAVKLYKEYGNKAMEIVRNHPYKLCEIAGIGFHTADKIAMNMGFDRISTERVDEGIMYVLTESEGRGHLCVEKHQLLKLCIKLLDTPELTEEMIGNRAVRLIHSGRIVSYNGSVYRAKTAFVENSLAESICNHLANAAKYNYINIDSELDREEELLGITFAPEQREAVKTALSNSLSIITGGPGTGKTMIQKAILDIYKRANPNAEICCCAPTGRAARRMEESTGYASATVHRTLNLLAGDDGYFNEPTDIKANLVLVDEVSMLDIYLAGKLFDAISDKCQLILVGDADQLPSVGPGAVLSEMISSEAIPVIRLDRVFRQNSGSKIATNAKNIRHGNVKLEYGADFEFIDSDSLEDSAKIISSLYMDETAKFGVDNVALLTPFRQKTETGVNALNEQIRELINPASASKEEAHTSKRTYRCSDKVMQIRNHDDVNNGDVGYITKITNMYGETTVYIDFGDGRLKKYDSSELDMIDLGYASTIHKSQGSEYKSVIINLQCAHYIMLTRPLIYTAITRGKTKVIIVGERRAIATAIKRTDTERRGTALAKRIKNLNY